MSKQHYVMLACMLRDYQEFFVTREAYASFVFALSRRLKAENPSFKPERFVRLCALGQQECIRIAK